jgi:thiamine-monophosphate kinase
MGGDLAHAEKTMCDIVVCGAVPRGTALRRDGARAGDAIYVSGALGASALGLSTGGGRAWRRHLRPQPRLALGRFLRARLRATAAMDLSDGLSLDLHRLCLASGLSAEIGAPPRFPGATWEQALHGGEDYELLFTAPARARVPRDFEGLPLTRIGTMRPGRPGAVELDGCAAGSAWVTTTFASRAHSLRGPEGTPDSSGRSSRAIKSLRMSAETAA